MIYPKDFENKIGFKSVKDRLTDLCISEMGKEFVEKMRFSSDIERIKTRLSQIEDFLSLLQNGVPFPVRDYNDLREEFHHLRIEGTVINIESLFALKPTLSALSYVLNFFKSESSEKVKSLRALSEGIEIDRHIFTEITRLIDDKGEIPDNASADLLEIRREIRRKQSSIDRRMRKILTDAKAAGCPSYDLLSCFDYRNLHKLAEITHTIENDFVKLIKNNGGKIKSFNNFEQFIQANL